jgi:DNA-binding GntR family transcriptional regulator
MPDESVIDLSKASLANQVEVTLRQQIVRGEKSSGTRLNEVEIARELGVSRGPVREAMQRLARDGLVVIEMHRGAFVRSLDYQELRQLFEVRAALESEAAALAAVRIDDERIRKLLLLQDESSAAVNEQEDSSYPDRIDIHRLVADYAQNDRISRMLDLINSELRLARSRSGATAERARKAVQEHQVLIEQLIARNADGARIAMRDHINHAYANVMQTIHLNESASAGNGKR